MNWIRKDFIVGIGMGIAALSLSAPALAQDGDGLSATGVPYVQKDEINGGEPIKLTYWETVETRAAYQRRWAEEYSAMYPNVEIEVVVMSWDSYWQSLSANIPAGSPTLFHMHSTRQAQFCDSGLMDPIPETVADPAYLDEHWIGFSEGALDCPGTGTRHYVPMGSQLPVLLINTEMWEDAGLTEADIPTSWEELRQAAIQLTQRDARDRITVAGLNMIPQEYLQNAVYQQGRYLFNEDGTKVQVMNPEYRRAVQFFSDLLHVDRVVDPALIELEYNAFVGKRSAMYIGFSWIVGVLRPLADELQWIAVPMPTPDGELAPAYGNMRFPVEAAVNPYASEEEKAVAWDFWHFNYSRSNVVLEDMALANGFVPPYDEVLDDPAVASDPVLSVLAPTMEYAIVSDVPDPVREEQDQLLEEIVLDGSDIEGRLEAAEERMNAVLAQRDNWTILERGYKHDDLMIPDQP